MRRGLSVWTRLVTATAIAGSVALASFDTGTGTGLATSVAPQTVEAPTLALSPVSARVTTTSASPVAMPLTFGFTQGYFADDRDLTATVTVSGTAPGTLRLDGTGLTFTSTATLSGGTVLSFSGTTTSVATALTGGRIAWLVPEQPGLVTLSASVRQDLPAGTAFNSSNGHYYQRVDTIGTWDNASASAAASQLFGLNGHLVTITSQAEQTFVGSLVSSNQWWIGASDSGNEGTWSWRTGPEAGDVFYRWDLWTIGQRGTGSDGFAWWAGDCGVVLGLRVCEHFTEPDNFIFNGFGEHVAALDASDSDRWRDRNVGETGRALVEYSVPSGGSTADRALVTSQTTLNAVSRLVDIVAYADANTGTPPPAAEWTQAMVTGVTGEALATSLATALASASISGQHVDTLAEAQTVADSYRRILEFASNTVTTAPTSTDYENLQLGALNSEELSRIHLRMPANGAASVDTYAELAARVAEARLAVVRMQEIVAYADADTGAAPNAAAWTEAMVTGVETEAFATSLGTVLASARVTGVSVSSIPQAQAFVDSYRRIFEFASSRGGSTAPTAADYDRLGLGTLASDVLGRMNFRVAVSGVGLVDTYERLTARVNEALTPPPPIVLPTTTTTTTTTTTVPPTTAPDSTGPDSSVPDTTVPTAPDTSTPPEPTSPPTGTTVPVDVVVPTVEPVIEFPDGRPLEVTPGEALMVSDGREATLQVAPSGDNEVSVTGEGVALTLAASTPEGEPRPLADGGALAVTHGDSLVVTGVGFGPQQSVEVWAFSTPVSLGTGTTNADGVLTARVTIPDALPPGPHTLQLVGLDPDGALRAVSLGVTVSEAQEEPTDSTLPAEPPATTPPAPATTQTAVEAKPEPFSPYSALAEPKELVETAVTAVAVLAAASAAGAAAGAAGRAAGGGRSSGGGSPAAEEPGAVEAVEGMHLEAHVEADEATRWQWLARLPGTQQLDALTRSALRWLAPKSPLLERVVGDGSTWRALFGSGSVVLTAVTVVTGILATIEVGGEALPPSLTLMAILMIVGTLDALAGAAGFAVIALTAVVSGNVTDLADLRTLIGLAAAFVAPGLVAKAFRPLRKPPSSSAQDWWERLADLVIGSLMAGMVAQGIVWGLNGMSGIYLPITDHTNRLALLVMGALVVNVLAEEIAARWFPARIREVTPEDFPDPSTLRQFLSVLFSGGVYVFVVISFLGNSWQLWSALALYSGPVLLGMIADRWPNVPMLWRVLPQGTPQMVFLLWTGVWVAQWLESSMGESADFARTSFVLLSGVPAILALLALLGREPAEDEERWNERPQFRYVYRLGGVVMVVLGVQSVI